MRLVSRVILGVTSNLVTDEALVIFHMFGSFYQKETNSINVHGIGVSHHSGKERSDATSFLKSSNPFLLSVELACLSNHSFSIVGISLTDRTICPRLGSSPVAKASIRVSSSLILVCAVAN